MNVFENFPSHKTWKVIVYQKENSYKTTSCPLCGMVTFV
jgi:hypothetical protein